MKNILISIQILFFILLGILGLFLFGALAIDKDVDFINRFEIESDEEILAKKILELTEQGRIADMVSLCEKYDAKVAVYSGEHGARPIYDNLLISTMSVHEEKSRSNVYFSEPDEYGVIRYRLYISSSTYYHEDDSFVLFETIWNYFYGNSLLIAIGILVSVLLLVLGIILMIKLCPVRDKIWISLAAFGVTQVGLAICFAENGLIFLLIMIALEISGLGVLAYRHYHKLSRIYTNMQAMAGFDSGAKSFSVNKLEEDVKSISEYVSKAVDDRLKSERLKTELITNVSHDLKTPLTSIINFSDLIKKEATDKDKNIAEYAEHLHNQSVKLKSLLDALLEASKAAAGAMEVNMESCNVHTLLEQCVVEYEQRLSDAGIALIENYPDNDTFIMADVHFLRRIFENLLINICKYAMPGSRSYIEASCNNGKVHISFKNVSKEPLNISANELTERFVRGDGSRHSEGHGLGLSIVKSLMDLQKAELKLETNADLFVAELIFDNCKE